MPVTNAIVGIDLADNTQMVVVCDHDSKVLAGKTFRCRAWDLGAVGLGRRAGRAERVRRDGGVLRADRAPVADPRSAGVATVDAVGVCAAVSHLTGWAGRSEDLTFDKTDE